MKIIIAPNALKGSISAHSAAKAMAIGVKRALNNSEVILKPISDGGDGFAEVLAFAIQAEKKCLTVTGPLGNSINTTIYIKRESSLAIIETASIAGLALLPVNKRNPMLTTSYGIGEAVKIALDEGVKHIMMGVGGSATNDAGIGMASALGVKFLNSNNEPVKPIGQSLTEISHVDTSGLDTRLRNVKVDTACDVNIPLYGEHGAAHIFAPQKGANSDQVNQLDKGLRHYADIVKNCLGSDIANLPGAGAAGGIGSALLAFCSTTLTQGIDLVLDTINFNEALENAALVLTAEGQFDSQTSFGKAPAGVAKRATDRNIPCILLAGNLIYEPNGYVQSDFTAAFSICPGPISLEMSIEHAFDNLTNTTEQVIRSLFSISKI